MVPFSKVEQVLNAARQSVRDYIFLIVSREGTLRVSIKTAHYDSESNTAMVVTIHKLRVTESGDIRVLVEYSDGDSGFVSISQLTIEQLQAVAREISKFE